MRPRLKTREELLSSGWSEFSNGCFTNPKSPYNIVPSMYTLRNIPYRNVGSWRELGLGWSRYMFKVHNFEERICK